MSYEPKEGTGWVEGDSCFKEVRRWQTMLDDETWLRVTVTAEGPLFAISRGQGTEHTVPNFEDMRRIEIDFGVHAWSVLCVAPCINPNASGQTLMLKAGP